VLLDLDVVVEPRLAFLPLRIGVDWLVFLVAFPRKQRELLAALGITGPESFEGHPRSDWQRLALEKIQAARGPIASRKPHAPGEAPILRAPDRPLTDGEKDQLAAYITGAIVKLCEEIRVAKDPQQEATLNANGLRINSLLKGASYLGVDTSALESDAYEKYCAACVAMEPSRPSEPWLPTHAIAKWDHTAADADPAELLSKIRPDCSIFGVVEAPPDEALRPLLDPKDPMPTARQLVALHFTSADHRTLHRTNGDFLRWKGTHYERAADEDIRAEVWKFLENADRLVDKAGNQARVPFQPTTTRAGDVFNALAAVTNVNSHRTPPAWLPGALADMPPALELLPCTNGLLHIPSRRLYPLTPTFLGLNALPYAYDAAAGGEPGEWTKFLRSVWSLDLQTIEALQEWFGYVLTADTSYQKILLIVGPKRSGKGTIARVLTALLGKENVAGPTLNSLADRFGLEPLIDKQLAIIADARLGSQANQSAITERLLSISGEDGLSVDRKYRTAWFGRLRSRCMLLTNELPRLTDASGALASRCLVLQCRESFYGRENHGLEPRLLAELPAILNWSLAGLSRLQARGRFVQPASAIDAIREIEDLASPIGVFLRDCCEIGPARQIECTALFSRWSAWCRANGRDHPGTAITFGRDLRAAVPQPTTPQVRLPDGSRPRFYQGLSLRA
jgi:putative DNA primase/helicase